MKRSKLILALFAGCSLALASLACGQTSSKSNAPDIYMAADDTGKIKSTAYAKTDDFFVFFDANGVEPGTQYQSRWYALDVSGRDPNKPFKIIDYSYDENKEGLSNIFIQLTSDKEWPAGRYRVEIYMNGAKVGEQQFNVE